jgi:hypothetical protein
MVDDMSTPVAAAAARRVCFVESWIAAMARTYTRTVQLAKRAEQIESNCCRPGTRGFAKTGLHATMAGNIPPPVRARSCMRRPFPAAVRAALLAAPLAAILAGAAIAPASADSYNAPCS